jgi:hypothetical protein
MKNICGRHSIIIPWGGSNTSSCASKWLLSVHVHLIPINTSSGIHCERVLDLVHQLILLVRALLAIRWIAGLDQQLHFGMSESFATGSLVKDVLEEYIHPCCIYVVHRGCIAAFFVG